MPNFTLTAAAHPSESNVFLTPKTVVNPVTRPLGANISGRSFRNKMWRTEEVSAGPNWERALRAVTGVLNDGDSLTGDSFHTSYGGNDPAYADGFWTGGTAEVFRISNGAMRPLRTSAITGSTDTQVDLADDGGAAVRAGDMVLVSRSFPRPSKALAVTALLDTAAFAPRTRYAPYSAFEWYGDDPNDTGVWLQESGEWFVRYDLSLTVASQRSINIGYFSGTSQTTYPIPEAGRTYRVEIDMRVATSRTANLSLTQANSGQDIVNVTSVNGVAVTDTFTSNVYQITLAAGRNVVSVEFNYAAVPTSSVARLLNLTMTSAGQYDLFGLRFFEAETSYLGVTPKIERIMSGRSGNALVSELREHSTVKTETLGGAYSLEGMIKEWLHSSLTNTLALGIPKFWFQPEFYMFKDADGLVEYLCGTSGPWADLRKSLGRFDPWITSLKFSFEISNETWNDNPPEFYNFVGMTDVEAGDVGVTRTLVYGLFFKMFIDKMKAAAAWSAAADAAFEDWIIGGHFATNYGEIAATVVPDANLVGTAPYFTSTNVSSNANAMETDDVYAGTLFFAPTVAAQRVGETKARVLIARGNGANTNLKTITYEDHAHSGPQGNWLESELRWVASKAMATQWLDRMLTQFAENERQTFFLYREEAGWASHHPVTGDPYPHHQWSEAWNEFGAGELIASNAVIGTSRDVVIKGVTYSAVPEIGRYTTRNGSRRTVMLINRNLPYDDLDSEHSLYDADDDGVRSVRMKLPWSSDSVTRLHMPGAYNDQAWNSEEATYRDLQLTSQSLGALSGDLSVTLDPGSAEMFVFQGVA